MAHEIRRMKKILLEGKNECSYVSLKDKIEILLTNGKDKTLTNNNKLFTFNKIIPWF